MFSLYAAVFKHFDSINNLMQSLKAMATKVNTQMAVRYKNTFLRNDATVEAAIDLMKMMFATTKEQFGESRIQSVQ